MTEPNIYFQCGLRLRSDLPLSLPVVDAGEWDVDIQRSDDTVDSSTPLVGERVAHWQIDDRPLYTAVEDEHGYRVRFHGCGDFVISGDLSSIEVREDPSGRSDILPILAAGTVAAFVLGLRGKTVLHASAVEVDGRVLAFVGHSGQGKTTLAALLCQHGAQLVTDDLLVVELDDEGVRCVGGAQELRLREAAAGLAEADPSAPTRTTADERLAYAPSAAALEPARLGAIVVPGPSREAEQIEITEVPPSDALFGLLSIPRVLGWTVPAVLERDFTTLSRLVEHVPVHAAVIPWGPPFQDGVADALLDLVGGRPA